jgi:hypothetical protein
MGQEREPKMPCLLIMIGLFVPRLTLFFLWLLSSYLSRAFETHLWPLLGFFVLPYTTLAYAIAINEGGALKGIWLALFVLGILLDFGVLGGTAHSRRRNQGR